MGRRGGGGGGGGGSAASNAKEMRLFLSHRMWREHRFVLAAALVVVAALLVSAFVQFAGSSTRMHRVEAADAALVARVFRSGEPWAVLCLRPDDAVPEVVDALPARLQGRVHVGVMDCGKPLVSTGKSVFASYGLKRQRASPTLFTVANGHAPKQVFPKDLQAVGTLAKRVLAQTKKTLERVRSSAQLRTRCLDRDACVLLLRGRRLEPFERRWVSALAHEHRAVAFAWADAQELQLSIEASLPPAVDGLRLVVFRRDGPESGLRARAFRHDVFDAVAVGLFVSESLADGAKLMPLAKNPTLKKRQASGRPHRTDHHADDGHADDREDDREDEDEVLDLDEA